MPTTDFVNESITVLLMMGINSDIDALKFCDDMEELVDSKPSLADIESLRNGMSF